MVLRDNGEVRKNSDGTMQRWRETALLCPASVHIEYDQNANNTDLTEYLEALKKAGLPSDIVEGTVLVKPEPRFINRRRSVS